MLASLPMYDRPELAEAHGAYWQLIRSNLLKSDIDAPDTLTVNGVGAAFWTDPDMVLSQTCGYPFRTALHDKVALVGTPDYGVAGCPPGYYRSCFVVRRDATRSDLAAYRTAVFAFNEAGSQSGFVAAQAEAAMHGFRFQNTLETGAHRISARAVAKGDADIACLDAVTWRLMQDHDDIADQLKVVALTDPTPGLPYICATSVDGTAVFRAVADAIDALPDRHRKSLGIKGIIPLQPRDYLDLNQAASSTTRRI